MFDPARLAALAAAEHPAALCTVVATQGSTPRKAGAAMVVIADGSALGSVEGTIGGGAVEHAVRQAALEVIVTTRPRLLEIPLTTQLGMCCGGTMTFFIQALRARPPLVILGAGHLAQALCRAAHAAGFAVTVADPREELLTVARFPDAVALVDDYEAADLGALPLGPDAFVVVATHDHRTDQALVERLLPLPHRWMALVGSRRKARLTRERCLHRGLDAARVARLRCPAGLDLGAETPEEIAVSIVAELVQVRRQGERAAITAAEAAEPGAGGAPRRAPARAAG